MREVGNGRYRLVRELGRGGMGAVWLAQDAMLGRDVAVKQLMVPGGVPEDERAVYRERVLREARTASRLADPAVVTVYDLVDEDGQTYIVMELINAPTLTDLVERDGPMTGHAAVVLAGQLLSALEAAHEAGVVHRDVKPGNVMVPSKGSAKLTDFGIAQSLDDPRLTRTGALIGSPAYMSPERFSGGEASPAWDLWALGATLFFAVEGHGAYERDSTSATMLAVMTERPLPRLADGPLAQLIVGLLDPEPGSRLQAHQARYLIEQAVGGVTRPVDPSQPRGSTRRMDPGQPKGPTRRMDQGRPKAQTRQAPQRIVYQNGRMTVRGKGTILAVRLALPLVVFLLLFFFVFKNLWFGDPLNLGTSFLDPTTSATPTTSKAAQQVLTYGPDGDIKADVNFPVSDRDCLAWVPAKGSPNIATGDKIGCFDPHDVQVLDTNWVNLDIDKDVPYPSVAELGRTGTAECTGIFLSAKVVGQDKENSLRYWVVVPTLQAWKVKPRDGLISTISSRVIYCFVGKADGSKLTEPVVGDS
jgi:eukaryotic-like serine/threonine-protein kinase